MSGKAFIFLVGLSISFAALADNAETVMEIGSKIKGSYMHVDGPLTCSPTLEIASIAPDQENANQNILSQNPQGYLTVQLKELRGQKEKIKTQILANLAGLANLARQTVESSENEIVLKRSSTAYDCSDCDEIHIEISETKNSEVSEIKYSQTIRRDDVWKRVLSAVLNSDDPCVYQRQP
jgi:hypothetical protein